MRSKPRLSIAVARGGLGSATTEPVPSPPSSAPRSCKADAISLERGQPTGSRHKAQNGYCIHIGNDQFASFTTITSKSRPNFFEVLLAGNTTHLINEAAIAYMREHSLSGVVINKLAEHTKKSFANRDTWTAHLKKLGITELEVTPDPVRVATEGALWGSIAAQGMLEGTVNVELTGAIGDDAPP